ncbi:MAG: SUMF1/EgtB/PvdO family nonheme iron enzyme [Polyangiaceae bacterium]|nr:SUMF1/EgtB/PvdO family nonheme iron enzyme [Polyangiaceae bacterium]
MAAHVFRTLTTSGALALFSWTLLSSGAARGVSVTGSTTQQTNASNQPALPPRQVRLKSPTVPYVWLRSVTTELGSSVLEILEAQELCLRGSRGRPGSERDAFCAEGLFTDEVPKHKVFVSGFFMDRTEVRVRDYQSCVAAQHCRVLRDSEGAERFFKPDDPVSMVTWFEAQAYCSFQGGRLPTEAEFERAARGVSRPVEADADQTVWRARLFPWGDLYNSHASNHGSPALLPPLGVSDEQALASDPSDGFEEKAPVGSFPWGATPEGILDLAGNVAEWVYDLYAPYPKPSASNVGAAPLIDPRGPATTESGMRVARGGHYKSTAAWLRGAARQAFVAETRSPTLGFRCAHDRAWDPEKRTP